MALCNYLNAPRAASALFWSASASGIPSIRTTSLNFGAGRVGRYRCRRPVLASRPRPDPKYFVGSGKAEEIKACAEAQRADLVLVDQTLTPEPGAQSRETDRIVEF